MKKLVLTLSIVLANGAFATPFTGNDASSSAMGNTGVASATPQNAFQFNPGLLADYPDRADFGLTLPSVKFFIDDSAGLVEAADDFLSGSAWDDFQNIDANAFNVAVFGDGGSEPAMTAVIGNILTDVSNIAAEVQDIQDDIADDSQINDSVNANDNGNSNTVSLSNFSASLTSNSGTLDTKVDVADTQAQNLSSATNSALSGLTGLNNKPLQLGLGIDILNAAIPSEKLGMALSVSTTTTVGAAINISDNDFDPVNNMSEDLTGMTARASELTTSMNALAAKNQELVDHLNAQPDPADYTGGVVNTQFQQDLLDWGDQLETLSNEVTAAQTDVDTKLTALTNYDGNYVSGGDITPPTVSELTSEVEFVGANISEVGVSVARKFTIYGEEVAVGITPKLQSINIFEKTIGLNNYETELDSASADPTGYFLESTTMLYRGNIDVGVAKSWDFYGRVRAGLAVKDIIPWTLESTTGTELLIRPKIRIGAAHETRFSKVAIDLDVTENKPLKYGVPTRYFGIGAELNAFGWAALRAGYRNNLSVDNAHVISGGIGLTPFGTGLSISGWVKPTFDDPVVMIQDVGAVVQLSMNF